MNIARWLLLALLSLPVLEIYLLIKLIGLLGFVFTLALLLSAAALGMFILRTQGFFTWMRVQQSLARGELPAREMVEGGILALGGLLLLIPGVLTDLGALLCLIPPIRRHLAQRILAHGMSHHAGPGGSDSRAVIEGEFRRDDDD